MIDLDKMATQLVAHEGEKLLPYTDTVGKLTIGVGRNLTDRGISKEESRFLLKNDITDVMKELDIQIPWWRRHTEARQMVLLDMAFNMGVPTFLTFKQTLAAVQGGYFTEAADRMLQSKWAKQVGHRATDLADMMRKG